MNCDATSDEGVNNTKTETFPTKTDIVFKKNVLCHMLLNFVSLSYGNELDLLQDHYHIPVEFLLGKDVMNKNFKFFFLNMMMVQN